MRRPKKVRRREGAPVVGAPDPSFPECVLVEVGDAPATYPRLDSGYNIPMTAYRVELTGKVRCLVTTMPDGLRLAWDTCGGCKNYFMLCRCRDGVRTNRAIEYIHDWIVARMAGETWDWTHPNYLGSLSRAEREARRDAPYRLVQVPRQVAPPSPTPGDDKPSTGRVRPRGQVSSVDGGQSATGKKKIIKRRTPPAVAAAVSDVDVAALSTVAEDYVGRMASAFDRPKKLRKVRRRNG
jgi:hypothetical protein